MNQNGQKQLLTKDGLAELRREHEELVHIKRPDMVIRLAAAREQGDLSENSEYTDAKDSLTFIDGRISELEEILRTAVVVTEKNHGSDAGIGSKVTLHIDGKNEAFFLVGEWEADPMNKKISPSSPLGKALMGKKVGEIVEYQAPVGKIHYKILEIE